MNEKKKLLVLGALVLVVLTVGVFQLTGSPQPTPAPTQATASKPTPNPDKPAASNAQSVPGEVLNDEAAANGTLVASNPLPKRDPFDSGRLTKPTLAPPQVQPTAAPAPAPRPTFTGSVPSGSLPPAGVMPVSITPGDKLPSPEDFTYTLAGVIVGEESAAVFADANGNQRLIVLGGSLEPNSKLVSVTAGKAVVRHYGKTITLTVGETPK